jgi:hypothetical protein
LTLAGLFTALPPRRQSTIRQQHGQWQAENTQLLISPGSAKALDYVQHRRLNTNRITHNAPQSLIELVHSTMTRLAFARRQDCLQSQKIAERRARERCGRQLYPE